MSAAQTPDPGRLEELRLRLDDAACDYPNIDAVVGYRPDLRLEETDRQARNRFVKRADPASENYAAEFGDEVRGTHEAMRHSVDCERWIPPEYRSIERIGGQSYWARRMRANEYPETADLPPETEVWHCELFGPPARSLENTGLRLFNKLAADAARLILPPSTAEGKALLSRWLIHLADRPEPIAPDSRRQYLAWTTIGGVSMSPMWVPVTPQNPPASWWAVRLHNVFQLSRLAIEQAIQLVPRAHAPVLTREDWTILNVLSSASRALLFSEIVREAATLVRENRSASTRKAGLMTLSETKVRERVPILEEQGLVRRPLGRNGKPTIRKGIGITDKGRALLENNSSPSR